MAGKQKGQNEATPRPAAETDAQCLLNEQIDVLRERQREGQGDPVALADAITRLVRDRATWPT